MGVILVCALIGFGIGVSIAVAKRKIKLSPLSLAAFLGVLGGYIYQLFNRHQKQH
jgi:hypothetical protein